ncbi:MAG: hypothetical protein ACOX7W_06345 [Christensenellales bacterium]|jgi:hypothetical protein
MEKRLWYHTPPTEWMEGLPIGNGRLRRVKVVVGYGSSLVLSGLARRFSLSQGARDIGDDVHITAAPGFTVTLEPPNRAG